jgi:hypothetical protein
MFNQTTVCEAAFGYRRPRNSNTLIQIWLFFGSCSGELHLPFGHKRDVWLRYMDENAKGNPNYPMISKVQFYRVWSERCRFIKVRAFHRFAICSTCTEISEEFYPAKTFAGKKLWAEARQLHFNDVRRLLSFVAFADPCKLCINISIFGTGEFKVKVERGAYHYRHQRCEDFGDGVSLVDDGQENSSNALPHFALHDKFTTQGWKIKARNL